MSDALPAAPAPRPTPLRVPDQLQQAKRVDAPEPPAGPGVPAAARAGERPPLAGVLLQLQSERAHG